MRLSERAISSTARREFADIPSPTTKTSKRFSVWRKTVAIEHRSRSPRSPVVGISTLASSSPFIFTQ
jgi:hypothetical protein